MEKCRIELVDRLKRQRAQNLEQLAENANQIAHLRAECAKAAAREEATYGTSGALF
jgi:hypothetical protein